MPFRVSVRNAKQVRDNMRQIAEDLHGAPMVRNMERAALVVTRRAKKNAPVDTGRLRNSITHEVRSSGGLNPSLQGIVGSNLSYAPYIEGGTGTFVGRPPHRVPINAVEAWARRHGMNPFLVARAITNRGGLEPRNYLLNAIKDSEAEIMNILDTGVRIIINR